MGMGQTEFLRNQAKGGVNGRQDDVALNLGIVAVFGLRTAL